MEIFGSASGRYGTATPNPRSWSNAGAVVTKISATLPSAGMHMRMPGLEEAIVKVDGRLRVSKSQSTASVRTSGKCQKSTVPDYRQYIVTDS